MKNKNDYIKACVLASAITHFACFESQVETRTQDDQSRDSNLVVGTFDAKTQRSIFNSYGPSGSSTMNSNILNQFRNWQALSAVPTVWVNAPDDSFVGPFLCSDTYSVVSASATHVGFGLIVSADHVIDGRADFQESRDSDLVHLYFDGNSGVWEPYTTRAGYDVSSTTGYHPPARNQNQFHQDDEESAHLANRLWALGLEQWAINYESVERYGGLQELSELEPMLAAQKQTRNGLRVWTAKEFREYATTQDGGPGAKDSRSGKDISVLSSIPKSFPPLLSLEEAFNFAWAPPFDSIVHPGVLFDKIGISSYGSCAPSNTTPLFGLSSNKWDRHARERGPLEMGPGYTDSIGIRTNIGSEDTCPDGVNRAEVFYDQVYTTLDAIPGHSGGALTTNYWDCNKDPKESGQRQYSRSRFNPIQIGVASEVAAPIASFEAWTNNSDTPTNPSSVPIILPSETGNADLASADGRTHYSPVGPEVVDDIKQVIGERTPNQDIGEPKNGSCARTDVDDLCIDYEVEYASVFEAVLGPYTLSPEDIKNSTENNSEVSSVSVRRMLCDYSRLTNTDWEVIGVDGKNKGWVAPTGFMVGLSGFGTSVDVSDKPGHIDDLASICAPWSSRPWIENWDYVYARANTTPGGRNSKIGHMSHHITPISEFITSGVELRRVNYKDDDKTEEIVRPISLKTCPPNMLLEGLSVTVSNIVGSEYLVSIDALLCDVPDPVFERLLGDEDPGYYDEIFEAIENGSHDSNNPNGRVDVPLGVWVDGDAAASKMSPYRRELRSGLFYSYGEIEFSLSQLIGPSDSAFGSNYSKGEFKCDEGSYMIGIGVERDSSLKIRTLELLCAEY